MGRVPFHGFARTILNQLVKYRSVTGGGSKIGRSASGRGSINHGFLVLFAFHEGVEGFRKRYLAERTSVVVCEEAPPYVSF